MENTHCANEQLYRQRLSRYVTAMRNEKPDCVPIRPFVAEFTARYAGYTCQEVCHDYRKALLAARKCAADFDWDAVVGNMVYVWTGLTQALGLTYYGIPGIDVEPNVGFQYREPDEEHALMKADEYDQLIDDPTAFLYNVWLPRVSSEIAAPGQPTSYRQNVALVKGSMAMLEYFMALGSQADLLRRESGTVSAISGIFKAPLDILADKLRGYLGMVMDLHTQPDKVLAACEALMPHLLHVALATADPQKLVPVGFWMHRGCVPMISMKHFHSHYWSTLKPIIQEIWAHGHQTLFYAEGNWNAHLESFAELPDQSIVYHVDRDDIFDVHRRIGHKFCLSGGISNYLLSYGSPADVRQHCRKVLEEVAAEGGYIMDAGAIMQDDTHPENVRAMTETTRQYGVYSSSSPPPELPTPATPRIPADAAAAGYGMTGRTAPRVKPGICTSWEEKRKELPQVSGDEMLLKDVWEQIESWGNTFIWQCLLSF